MLLGLLRGGCWNFNRSTWLPRAELSSNKLNLDVAACNAGFGCSNEQPVGWAYSFAWPLAAAAAADVRLTRNEKTPKRGKSESERVNLSCFSASCCFLTCSSLVVAPFLA